MSMVSRQKRYLGWALSIVLVLLPSMAGAQSLPSSHQINFDSFTGVYHLSRDAHNLSLLTAQETIVADFPAQASFYGIKRELPTSYQNHSVQLKILNVTDATGNALPYKTATADGNLIVTTGDPAITLYGSQTFKINYRTSGVIAINQKNDTFLLNINGRGWDQPFNKVSATINIPAEFQANVTGQPVCYTALNNSTGTNCQITTQKQAGTTVITAKAGPMSPHQALIVKLSFTPATFTNQPNKSTQVLVTAGVILLTVLAGGIIIRRKNGSPKPAKKLR